MSVYSLHGVAVATELELPALPAGARLEPELWFGTSGVSPGDWTRGEELARSEQVGARYRILRSECGLLCQYAGLGDVLFETSGSAHFLGDASHETVRALFSGSALAAWLVARGELVLHASAVSWPGCSIAVVGASHAGKTTLAAQCVVAGASLVADDVLRVTLNQAEATWHSGVRWLRLRSGSRELVAAWRGEGYHSLPDDRWVVVADLAGALSQGKLDALVLPRLDATVSRVHVVRIAAAEALRRLVLVPRVRGLSDPSLLQAQLRKLGELCRAVPCFEAALPPGPPFLTETALRLRELITRALKGPT